MRKAGGDPGINPCFKPASSEMRKAGGEAGMIEWRKPTNTPANGKTNAAVTDGASHKTGLKVYSKSAKHNTRKAGGDAGIDPCFKPGNTKPASSEMRKAGGQPDKAGGDTAVTIAIQPSSLNGDGKTANSKTRKAGGNTGIDPCWKPDAKSGRPSGKRIVQPNSSSATKSAISGSTGGAPKPDGRSLPLPQTGVPK
jgi:hypothetical protein